MQTMNFIAAGGWVVVILAVVLLVAIIFTTIVMADDPTAVANIAFGMGIEVLKALALGLIVLALAGCESLTPYVALDHMSDPREQDDGFTWGCAGIKSRHQLSVIAGYCWDIQGTGWNVAEARIEYDLLP